MSVLPGNVRSRWQAFFAWLAEEPSVRAGFVIAIYTAPLLTLPAAVQTLVLRIAGNSFADRSTAWNVDWVRSFPHSAFGYLFLLAWLGVGIAVAEELLFRLIPLRVVLRLRPTASALTVTAVVASIVFGYGHGLVAGVGLVGSLAYIWTRGAGGLVLSAVFLKCGGFKRHPLKGLCFSALTHWLYDAAIFTMVFWGWRTV
jgi:membrane protease YdiL (CAAX protease family)